MKQEEMRFFTSSRVFRSLFTSPPDFFTIMIYNETRNAKDIQFLAQIDESIAIDGSAKVKSGKSFQYPVNTDRGNGNPAPVRCEQKTCKPLFF